MIFRLVPETHWQQGQRDPNSWATPDGRILLYRAGDVEPRLILDANQPVTVPAGTWLWTAEATGYVSVAPGRMVVPEKASETKTLIWPVVPACELMLAAPRRWQGVERLDVVSVQHGTVHPVEPQRRQRLWIPAGAFLTYSVSRSSLYAIGQLRTCQAGEQVPQGPPALPSAERQDLMVTLEVPEEVAAGPQGKEPLVVGLQPPRSGSGGVVAPTVMVAQGRRSSAFFLDVPAAQDLQLHVQQPALRTVRQTVEKLGGSARELPPPRLQPRLKLLLPIDYRPLRPHKKAEILVRYCATGKPDTDEEEAACQARDPEPLKPGLAEYIFEGLDNGFYYFDARIDDEVVLNFGTGFELMVRVDDQSPWVADIQLIREMEIYGNLLLDEKPVVGEVLLQPRHGVDGPIRRFPTGDDLLYHMYFFGRLPSVKYEVHALPEPLRELEQEELRGLWGFSGYSLVACAEDGTCRTFNVHSQLAGEGRLDLDLGSDLSLEVAVREAVGGAPLADAWVLTDEPGKALLFARGEVTWIEPRGMESLALQTGTDGLARVRNLKPGKQGLVVTKSGYQKFGRIIDVPVPGNRIEVELQPEDESGGVELRFADGSPVSSGFLLRISPDGQQDRRCSKATDAEGRARFAAEHCLQGGWIVVLHVDARLTVLPAEDLARVPQLVIERGPATPLRLRVTDGDGAAIVGAPVAVRLRGVEIGPNEMLAAASTGMPFYVTDDRGEILLRGVDPQAPEVADVFILTGGRRTAVSIAGYRAGEVVEVVVE